MVLPLRLGEPDATIVQRRGKSAAVRRVRERLEIR
jgi:hypothetical protein